MKKIIILGLIFLAVISSLVSWTSYTDRTGSSVPLPWQAKIPRLSACGLTSARDGTVYVVSYSGSLSAIDQKGVTR